MNSWMLLGIKNQQITDMYTTTWMKLKIFTLSERSCLQRSMYFMIPFMQNCTADKANLQ